MITKESGGQRGCYVMVTNRLFLNKLRVELGKGKWKYSKGILFIVEKNGNGKVTNNSLPFSLMFHIAERLLYFDIF